MLIYALVVITSPPTHGAFARRQGPVITAYLALWWGCTSCESSRKRLVLTLDIEM
jgi:hypothetical protein